MRHETVWVDRTIDRIFIKTDRMVREVTAAVMIENYRIDLTFHLLFASFRFASLFSFFFLFYFVTASFTMQ